RVRLDDRGHALEDSHHLLGDVGVRVRTRVARRDEEERHRQGEECTFHGVIVTSVRIMRRIVALSTFVLGCGASSPALQDASAPLDAGADASDASMTTDSGVDAGTDADAGADAGDPVAKLLALTSSCNQVSSGLYSLNAGDPGTVPICSLTNTFFW